MRKGGGEERFAIEGCGDPDGRNVGAVRSRGRVWFQVRGVDGFLVGVRIESIG